MVAFLIARLLPFKKVIIERFFLPFKFFLSVHILHRHVLEPLRQSKNIDLCFHVCIKAQHMNLINLENMSTVSTEAVYKLPLYGYF